MKKTLSLLSCNKTTKLTKDHCHTRNGNRIRITLRQALLVAAVTMLSMSAVGQTYTGTSTCYGTITRNDDVSGKRMHYIKTGPTSGWFVPGFIYGGNNPYSEIREVSGYNINDFTIFNDTVYFCGEDSSGVGFYGWTSTQNDQNFQWTFHIYKLRDNFLRYVTDVRHIKVFRSGQDLNVLLIGTYKYQPFLNPVKLYSSLIHVQNNNTCTMAYSSATYFEDVAILDDYVATIERKGGRDYSREGHYLRLLNKSQFTLNDTLFDIYYSWDMVPSIGHVRLQGMDTNRFVSVYRNDTAYYFNVYSVNNGDLVFHKYYKVLTNTMPDIGDVAYSSSSRTLVVLHNIDTSGTAMFYNCSSFPNITLANSSYPYIGYVPGNNQLDKQTRLLSVTRNFFITGISADNVVFWNTSASNCQRQRQMSVVSLDEEIHKDHEPISSATMTVSHSTFMKGYTMFGVSTKCQSFSPGTGDEDEE